MALISIASSFSAGFVVPIAPAPRTSSARAAVNMIDEDDPTRDSDLNFDMGLLKIPRMMTPQQAAFEEYRERRRAEAEARNQGPAAESPGKTPLGLDPVIGDPVDLRKVFQDQGYEPPSDVDIRKADADMERLLREDAPDGLGNAIDDILGRGEK